MIKMVETPMTRASKECDLFAPSRRKEWPLIRLLATVSLVVIFTVGINQHIDIASEAQIFFFPNSTGIYPADCSGIENFMKPPESLLHNMTDKELFWRASMVPQRDGYPFQRVPKVAFMFLIRGPLPFMPLWERFFRGHDKGLYSVYLHTAPGYKFDASEISPFYRRQIPSKRTEWGSITLIDAERRLLSNALLDFSNERFILLSESCIPIHNFTTIYTYLTQSTHSFIECYDKNTSDARGRYSPRMIPHVSIDQFRKGSQWFEISRELAVQLLADDKLYDVFERYAKNPSFPDEHYIPTFVDMHYPGMKANRTVTWVDWSTGSLHPVKYRKGMIRESLIMGIKERNATCMYNSEGTSICYLFARKFDANALEPLLNLSSRVLGF